MMTKKTLATVLALTLVLSVSPRLRADDEPKKAEIEKQMADAKKQLAEASRKIAELSKQLAQQEAGHKVKSVSVFIDDHPRLGLLVNTDENSDTDSKGALLEGVTPGGPAAEAGLKADDIITKFNGEKLAGPNPDADEDESPPGIRLMSLAKKIKAGDKVTLEYLRGNQTKTVTITPRAMENSYSHSFTIPDIPYVGDLDIDIPDLPEGVFDLNLPRNVLNMELVELNPELGEYFGASEGLLVVNAPKDSTLQLKPGDVLLKIGDRKVTEPSQAYRILRSYDPGESVSLEIVRKQKHQTLTVKMPERTKEKTMRRRTIEVPQPPEAPTPPPAPAPRASLSESDGGNA